MPTILTMLGLTMATLVAAGADTNRPGRADSLTIYWPMAYSSALEGKKTREIERFEATLKKLDVRHRLQVTPVRRAYHLYEGDPFACVVYHDKPLLDGELVSRPFGATDHWLYVRKDAGFKSRADLKSAGTLEGAERYVVPQAILPVTWHFAPSYEALIGMLKSGRVDAVTLGPLIDDGLVTLPEDVVKLDDVPFAHIALRLHCRPGKAAEQLVKALDQDIEAAQAAAP